MKHKSIVQALNKSGFTEIIHNKSVFRSYFNDQMKTKHCYRVVGPRYEINWELVFDDEEEATNLRVKLINEESNLSIDYHPYYYPKSIRHAINILKEV